MAIFTKKTWKARVTQFPNRRTLTKDDGTTEVVTVSRNEGTVTQAGDAFNAANMNDLEDRVYGAFNGSSEVVSGGSINTSIVTGTINIRRFGGVVGVTFLGMSSVTTMNAGQSYKIATVPSSIKPSLMQFGIMLYNGIHAGRLYIDTNGDIYFTVESTTNFGNGLRATLVYFI